MNPFTLTLIRNQLPQPPKTALPVTRTTATSVPVRYSGLDVRVGTSAADYLTSTTGISYPVLHEALRQESPSASELPGEFGAELQRMLDLVRERLRGEDQNLEQIQEIASAYAGSTAKLRLLK